jgi:hypothetical protein
MDDEKIRQLTSEVLGVLRGPSSEVPADLEARLARLEAAVARIEARLSGGAPAVRLALPVVSEPAHTHPSLQVLSIAGGSDRCVLEPDKPCVQSHACRTFGH